jgi:hypothetical protein
MNLNYLIKDCLDAYANDYIPSSITIPSPDSAQCQSFRVADIPLDVYVEELLKQTPEYIENRLLSQQA